jgi:hypothetical protein
MLSFTAEVFFALLAQYNATLWPLQIPALLLGLAAIILACRPMPGGDRTICVVLAVAWLWTGIAFLWSWFATISFAAPAAAACFVLQGLLLLWSGAVRGRLRFRFGRDAAAWAGLGIAGVGLGLYPMLGAALGRDWAALPVFGLAPCPTVIVTIGLLLLAEGRWPVALMIVPLLWGLAAGLAAWDLGIPETLLILPVAAAGLALMLGRGRA